MDTREIQLSQGKVAIVDAEDYDWLMQWKWYTVKNPNTFYAVRSARNADATWARVYMHRQILATPAGLDSDHRNGNGLDNRRENLRICTHRENTRNRKLSKNNTSGCRGVCWDADRKNWRARIGIDDKVIHLGFYDSINEAIAVRRAKEKEIFGDFAYLNQLQ